MSLTQKLINDGNAAVDEMLVGIMAAHPEHLWRPDNAPRAVVAKNGPRAGKVALVIGGGSGHEPTFLGYVGKGLADAAAIGNVFASPPPQPAVDAAMAASGDAGVLFMYGNYAGDVMNFDMAAELLEMEGIEARTVLTTDDIASAPLDQRQKRRGVAGNVFIFKAAGAAADMMMPLDEVERIARHANDRTFTMGVALSSCSLPQTRKPSFDLPVGEMEIGMGIHGEPGVRRGTLRSANDVADEIMDAILAEMKAPASERVAVLVNSLGATPLMELYILNARIAERLKAAGLVVHKTLVGPYCTSLDMAGASITIMHLDDELQRMIDHPCDCAMFRS
ncbi:MULTISPECIES: dihydroxyacetone kinase subunit DhaK [unclassified Mesorhizobium]|uniref:dihydroxyacetone kinase subunit DhaK n=1 Tax=unclassified Mesorhizobium TaxID=325217 RepID=UPI001125D943|nr:MULTISPECIES: dihydroxyacetone kinase subunit DhaK [unclassified Mesorhizobium]TPL01050.1 dihydroxyacetone kinase subunit DhaK [Mesorhizobium sp. B2-4-16]TPL78070.1 dihydroxyacetone kinase subunit DhaK [Mesorhizobium sp. B2-4-3]